MEKQSGLSPTEERITRKNIERMEKDVEILEHQKKRALLDIEGIPLIQYQYEQKLKQIELQIKQNQHDIENAKSTLKGGKQNGKD